MAHGDITHIDIPVTDLTAASGFYSALFGWQIAEPPGFEGYPMWQAPNGISGGGLAPRSEGFTQPRSYVEVDSIDDTVAVALAAGGSVAMEKQPITDTSAWAVVVDPDGNHIGLFEGVVGM
ncbi:VOC family protein [Microbacterium sp. LWH10-1.2]|uniref:VOC family protein n=1 Tax=unclassified Microbacterium TaxID=2609290 RepID=UPI0031397AA5